MDLLLKYDLPTLALVLAVIAVIVRLTFSLFFSSFLGLSAPSRPAPPPKKFLDYSKPVPLILI